MQNLIQVVFALNEVYFPGEKKLAIALEHLPVRPLNFIHRVQALIFPAATPTWKLLEMQRLELVNLVSEVEGLVRQAEIGLGE